MGQTFRLLEGLLLEQNLVLILLRCVGSSFLISTTIDEPA